MKTILYINPNRDAGLRCSGEVRRMLEERGVEYVTATDPEELSKVAVGAELAVTFGGDGTILHCARVLAPLKIPILAVNLGTMGFMAELEPEELPLLDRALKGDYAIERRMTLDVAVTRGGRELYRDFALNDVVVTGLNRVIGLSVLGDGKVITSFAGDGVVISTPTGSTAYSMAAGGPIAEPDAENILVTPICPHMLWARSWVLSPNRTVSVELSGLKDRRAFLSADGNESVALREGDGITVRRSDMYARLVRLTDRSFYEKVSLKLGEKR